MAHARLVLLLVGERVRVSPHESLLRWLVNRDRHLVLAGDRAVVRSEGGEPKNAVLVGPPAGGPAVPDRHEDHGGGGQGFAVEGHDPFDLDGLALAATERGGEGTGQEARP